MSKDFEYTGTDILEVLEDAKNYNRYLTQLVYKAVATNKKKSKTVVDFGAGTGTFAKMLTLSKKDSLVCVELDDKQRNKMKQDGLATAKNLTDIKGSVDVLYSLNVFEHIEDDFGVMRDVADKLSVGGVVLVYVPANQILYSSMDRLVEHHRRYNKKRIRSMVEDAGLTVIDLRFVDPIGYFAALLYKLIDKGDGKISPNGVKVFDRLVFPISRFIEPLTRSFLGKNLMVIAEKKK